MTNEFNNDENVTPGVENNNPVVETGSVADDPAIESGNAGSGNYNSKKPKIVLAVLAIIAALIGIICIFKFTIASSNKAVFMNYLDKDVNVVKDFYNGNEFAKFVTNKEPKDLNIDVNYSIINMAMNFVLNTDSLAMKYEDKYYLVDYNELDKLYKTLEIDDEVPSIDADTFSKEDIKEIKKFVKECYNIFTDSLTNYDFTVTKDDKITINGNEVEAKSVELKITSERLLKILRKLLEELRSSDVVDIYFEKVGNTEITKEEFLKSIDDLLLEVDNGSQLNDDDETYITYKMYDKDGIIARELAYCESGDVENSISLVTYDDYYELTNREGMSISTVSDTITKEKDVKYHDISIIDKERISKVYTSFEITTARTTARPITTPSQENTFYEEVIRHEEELKIKAENNDTKFTLLIDDGYDIVIDIENGLKISTKIAGVNIALELTDNKELTTKKIIENGAVIINDMTKDELTQLFNDLFGISQLPFSNDNEESTTDEIVHAGSSAITTVRPMTKDEILQLYK